MDSPLVVSVVRPATLFFRTGLTQFFYPPHGAGHHAAQSK